MAARLGNVLYWLGCLIAGLFFIGGFIFLRPEPATAIIMGALGVASWLTGRAVRYILAGT